MLFRSCSVRKILTVARAIFPFKGYIIGLLDDFIKLCDSFDDIELHIVSFGEDYEILIDKINNLPEKVRKKVKLDNGLKMEEIRSELKKTYVYIGMGTTILDAADEAVPCIVSAHTTMKNECIDFFHRCPMVISQQSPGQPAYGLLQKILSVKDEEYKIMKADTYRAYKDNYDIDIMMQRLIKRCSEISCKELTAWEISVYNLLNIMRKVKRRLNRIVK